MAEPSDSLTLDDELHLQFSDAPTLQVLGAQPPWAYSAAWFRDVRTRLTELTKNPVFDGVEPVDRRGVKPAVPFLVVPVIDLINLLYRPMAIRLGATIGLTQLLMPEYATVVAPQNKPGSDWSTAPIPPKQPLAEIDRLDGGQRQELLEVQRQVLELLSEVPFFAERREVLARLLDRVADDSSLLAAYRGRSRSELVKLWRSEVFDDEAFAVFPEQTGTPLDLLAWAVDRYQLLSTDLAAATPETELTLPLELAGLLHQVKRADVPAGLGHTTLGSAGAAEVQQAFEDLRESVDRTRWTRNKRAWLGRVVESGRLAEAREYVAVQHLLAGVLQSLPDRAKRPETFSITGWFLDDLEEVYHRRQRLVRGRERAGSAAYGRAGSVEADDTGSAAPDGYGTTKAGDAAGAGRAAAGPSDSRRPDPDPVVDLAGLPGLAEPKARLAELIAEAEVAQLRLSAGMPVGRRTRHLVFSGNPGTGKSLVAGALAAGYHRHGVLESGHVVEASRTDLLAETTGDTAAKVLALFDEAAGGVLLVNDAHLLHLVDSATTRTREREALATLADLLAERGDELVVVLAGQPTGLQQLLADDAGLRNQLSATIAFADYTDDELRAVFLRLAGERGFVVDEAAATQVLLTVQKLPRAPGFGNARLVATLLDQVSVRQAVRVAGLTDPGPDQVRTILAADLPSVASTILAAGGVVPATDPLRELDLMVGLTKVKERVRELRTEAQADRLRLTAGVAPPPRSRHMVFVGNPGTGKTTVARLLAAIYQELGILGTGQLIEVTRTDLIAQYLGQTAPKVRKAVERALGGVLFIDEAYSLVEGYGGGHSGYGSEAIATLVPLLEEYRDDLVVILAGYPREMKRLFEMNSGLESRFPTTLEFPDYSQSELAAVFTKMAADAGYRPVDGVARRVAALLAPQLGYERFGNGRAVRTAFERTLAGQAARIMAMTDPTEDQLRTLTVEDVPRTLGPAREPGFYL